MPAWTKENSHASPVLHVACGIAGRVRVCKRHSRCRERKKGGRGGKERERVTERCREVRDGVCLLQSEQREREEKN